MSWSRDRQKIRTTYDYTTAYCNSNSEEKIAIASVWKPTKTKQPL